MEAEIVTAVASSLAGAMTTSAWQTVRGRIAALFGREREEDVAAELETVREECAEYGDDTSLVAWLRRAVREQPGFAQQLQAVLAESGLPQPVSSNVNVIHGGTFEQSVIMAHTVNQHG